MRRFTTVAVALVCAATSARGDDSQPQTPLGPREVIDALASHPALAAARAGLERAHGQLLGAEGAFDLRTRLRVQAFPSAYYDNSVVDAELRLPMRFRGITPFVGWRLGRGEFPIYDLKAQTLRAGEVRAGVEVPLLRDGAIDRPRAELQKAELADDLARVELQQRVLEVERDAVVAYWNWVATGNRLNVRVAQLELARARDEGIQRTIAQGNTAPIEAVDNARVIVARETTTVMARRDLVRAALELSMFLRDRDGKRIVPQDTRVPELGPLPPPLRVELDVETAIAEARGRAPSVAAVGVRAELNAVDLALARNQQLPAVTTSAFISRGLGPPDPEIPDRSTNMIGVSLIVELPVQQRQARGAAEMARADRTRIGIDRGLLLDRIAIDVGTGQAELAAARTRAELAERQLELAEQLASAERTRFSRGDTTILIVNLREEAAADAAVARIDAIADYYKARALYMVALGRSPREAL